MLFRRTGAPSWVRIPSLRNHTAGACKGGKRSVPAIVSGAKLARSDMVSSAPQLAGGSSVFASRTTPTWWSFRCRDSHGGLHLTGWPLSGRIGDRERRAFRRTLPKWLLKADIPPPSSCILQDSDCMENGVRITRLLRIRPL